MVNSITLEGNLTRDAETKSVGDTMVTQFCIANNRYAGKDKPQKVIFRDCKGWGNRFAAVGQYLTKGKRVVVSGVEEEESWEGRDDGVKHTKVVIVLNDLSLVGDAVQPRAAPAQGQGGYDDREYDRPPARQAPPPARRAPPPPQDDFQDDIPF